MLLASAFPQLRFVIQDRTPVVEMGVAVSPLQETSTTQTRTIHREPFIGNRHGENDIQTFSIPVGLSSRRTTSSILSRLFLLA